MEALRQIDAWGAGHAAAGVVARGRVLSVHGPADVELRWASVTKLVVAYATLIAAEESVVDLDAPAGPQGATVRHLLAHTSGLPFEGESPIARPGQRRIYSNAGYDELGRVVGEAADMPVAEYLRLAVVEPLGMAGALRGSPGSFFYGTLDDLLRFALELLDPTLIARETLAEATSVQFPGLVGVLPGFGRWDPNDWGLGFELKDAKSPHWTGTQNSPATFGHFGGSGTFLWADPARRLACGCLTDREFADWALTAWPRLGDAVLAEASELAA